MDVLIGLILSKLARLSGPVKAVVHSRRNLQGSALLSLSYQASTLANITESAQAKQSSVDAVCFLLGGTPDRAEGHSLICRYVIQTPQGYLYSQNIYQPFRH